MTKELKFEFNKIDEHHYAFVMKSEDIHRTEVVSKQYAKDHYKQLKEDIVKYNKALTEADKKLLTSSFVADKELDDLIAMNTRAADYAKKRDEHNKVSGEKEYLTDAIGKMRINIELMEKALPELKRMKE